MEVAFGDTPQMAQRIPQVQQYYAALPAARFPNLFALGDSLFAGDVDERFEFGFDLLVRGLAALGTTD